MDIFPSKDICGSLKSHGVGGMKSKLSYSEEKENGIELLAILYCYKKKDFGLGPSKAKGPSEHMKVSVERSMGGYAHGTRLNQKIES